MSLDDSVALITGASSGIGRATAEALAERGAAVAVSARREDRLESLADDLREDHDADVLVQTADVTDDAQVAALVEATVDEFGRLDTVVANAGLAREGAVEELDTDRFRQMLDVNCAGVFYTARESLPHLRETEGLLVLVGSMAGQYPRPASPVYAATKWFVRGFGKSLAGSVGPDGVGVTVVNPTEVRTEFGSEDGESLGERLDPDEAADPGDVAEGIAFAAEQEPPNVVQELDFYRRDKFEGW
ncbi:SDR family oxidoreductase [Halomicrobium salinisoli]|uniref:SDR family oxidoreductase n=1 Tax=Halomicrobium salinisoli TaxID=2878391 RepID=UPI001CF0D064|nr:SDR family oxidoreductase [Halomicrobium salinisoli]